MPDRSIESVESLSSPPSSEAVRKRSHERAGYHRGGVLDTYAHVKSGDGCVCVVSVRGLMHVVGDASE